MYQFLTIMKTGVFYLNLKLKKSGVKLEISLTKTFFDV